MEEARASKTLRGERAKLENLVLKGKESTEPERAAEAREARRSGEFSKKMQISFLFSKIV